MNRKMDFQCCQEDKGEELPLEVFHASGVSFCAAHTIRDAMAMVAGEKSRLENDKVCRIPFCVTIEAEAFGANVIIPTDYSVPRVGGYRFKRIEDLAELNEFSLDSGRIREVLSCLAILRNKGHITALNVEGPFTILGMLLDAAELYKGIFKQRELMEHVLATIENSLVRYMLAALDQGVQIISYADPTGVLNIVGPRIYKEFSGKTTFRILKRVEGRMDAGLIHLCGKTSLSLKETGYCTVKPLTVPVGETYGGLLGMAAANKTVRIVGHNCMKNSRLVHRSPFIWQIELAGGEV